MALIIILIAVVLLGLIAPSSLMVTLPLMGLLLIGAAIGEAIRAVLPKEKSLSQVAREYHERVEREKAEQ